MDVTRENFAAVLPEVTASIGQCSFIAFDAEFTGLLDGVRLSWADLPQERYHKLRQGASRFVLMQFGLCLFSQDKEVGKYHVTPYKFYLFHSTPHRKLDKMFTCQVSSLSLLAAHGMDFNRWIREGIPYLSETEERWWKEKRRTDVSDKEPDLHSGFLQLIRTIAKAGKPLVGHNCLLDLLHMHTHFIGPLPELLVEFKMELHKWFPCIYDTKVVAMESELESHFHTSSLPDLYSQVRSPPFPQLSIELPDSCSHYKSSKSSAHEASFDAYITGYCMLAMSKLLGETRGAGAGNLLSAVSDHQNRIFLQQCEGMLSFHLAGTDPPVSREHVFLMTFPPEMTTDDIRNLFSPFGGARVCWINSTSAHIIMTKKDQAKQAFASLSSCGVASGMKFVLAPSHPPSSPLSPSSLTSQKRPLEQDTPPSHSSKAARLFEDCSDW